MPHFGLMDENALGPVEGPLLRAKLHYRCGKRRLREGKISLGVLTIYDAVISAMQWYISKPGNEGSFQAEEGGDMNDDKTVYRVLTGSRVLDGKFDYDAFNEITDKALYQDMAAFDYTEMLKGAESVMTQLGVLPFDEGELPPEDPSTV